MINLGNKKVSKLLVGSNVIYQDSDGWIPLELPDGVTGQAFFKDIGSNAAFLSGVISFSATSDKIKLISPPDGYRFSQFNWNATGLAGGAIVECDNSKGVLTGYDTLNQHNMFAALAQMTLSDGDLLFNNFVSNVNNSIGYDVTLSLCRRMTRDMISGTIPATMGIERV